MKKILYVECNSGISGDMFVASLLDLGANREYVLAALEKLGLSGYQVSISRVKRSGLDVCDFDVVLEENPGRDHDMEYLYGHMRPEQEGIPHEHHGHEHSHEHGHHEHSEHEHSHEHRSYSEIRRIISGAGLPERVEEYALKIFEVIARAEAKAHGVSMEEVHFHEVGAIDSIVDVVAAAACVDSVGADSVVFSPLTEGNGSVRCQHGILPVPVPAVLNILADSDLKLRKNNIHGELITPTGAAIAAALQTEPELPEQYSVKAVGAGAGKRAYEPPSLVRAMLLEVDETVENNTIMSNGKSLKTKDGVWKLETDIDDSTGETLGYLMDKLYEEGAREVHFSQIQMKKNRPGVELTVICDDELREGIESIIFEETTTIGIRRAWMQRTVLPREQKKVETDLGEVEVKEVTLPNGTKKKYPEYESLKQIALWKKLSLVQVKREVDEVLRYMK